MRRKRGRVIIRRRNVPRVADGGFVRAVGAGLRRVIVVIRVIGAVGVLARCGRYAHVDRYGHTGGQRVLSYRYVQRPVFLRLKGLNFRVAVVHHARRHGLHAPRRQSAPDFLPQ